MGILRDFAAWWADRMAELLPRRMRLGENDTGDALVAELQPAAGGAPSFLMFLRRSGRETALGPASLAPTAMRRALPSRRPASVLLRPPGAMLLERDVLLPLAAEPVLNDVLTHEMDRLTPFTAAELYWRWNVAERDAARGRLRVRLSLVPRAALATAIGTLAEAGIAPAALTVRGPDGNARRIGLSQPGADSGSLRRRRALGLAAAGCAALALAAAVLPFVQQERDLRWTTAEIEAMRPAVAEAEALRGRIAAVVAGSDVLAVEAARVGSAIDALAAVTTLLPDDSFLTAFAMRGRRVTLTGQSAAAARLIPLLSASPAVREAAFLSPVTRAPGSGGEAFSLRVEMVP